jgi:hypothetical protein
LLDNLDCIESNEAVMLPDASFDFSTMLFPSFDSESDAAFAFSSHRPVITHSKEFGLLSPMCTNSSAVIYIAECLKVEASGGPMSFW